MNFIHRNTKTITESDNNLFCLLTMNPHPLHLDAEYAKGQKYGKRVVVGTLVFSLAVGLTVPEISQDCRFTLRYDEIIHHAPVFIGDTIRAESYVADDGKSKVVETKVFNQHNKSVLSFYRKVLK